MTTAYVGCRTTKERNARGKGLKVYRIDEQTLEWAEIQLLDNQVNPSYMAFDSAHEHLYVVHGDREEISSFTIDVRDGTLTPLNTVTTDGHNPVFVTVDPTDRYIYIVNLQGGNIVSFARRADGSLSEPIHEITVDGIESGKTSCPHQCQLDPSGSFLFVPAQGRANGYGQMRVFSLLDDGSLKLTCRFRARQNAEPRNVAIHPNGRWAYLIHERGNYIEYFAFDAQTGTLAPRQIVSSLPETYTGEGQASTVVVHPTRDFLYASNRLHDSIGIYAIEHQTGYLHSIGFFSALGVTPRFITTDATGDHLFVANEDSDTIRVLNIDKDSGRLTFTGRTIKTESPVCVLFG